MNAFITVVHQVNDNNGNSIHYDDNNDYKFCICPFLLLTTSVPTECEVVYECEFVHGYTPCAQVCMCACVHMHLHFKMWLQVFVCKCAFMHSCVWINGN